MRSLLIVALLGGSAFAAAQENPLKCKTDGATALEKSDPRARKAAQHGLDYLAKASTEWSKARTDCFGCHVHSVTLEGLVIGRRNQYTVANADMALMIDRIIKPSQGIHGTTFTTARAFGGVALARYDRWVDGKFSDDLLKVSRKLIESQNQDGSVKVDDTRFPVESGVMQATFQAMQSWRQAYARTADEAWLAPIRRAEAYIASTAASWKSAPAQLTDLNYALMGLAAAGVGAGEELTARLQRYLVAKQNPDGGWGFRQESDAFATGQSLYALRTLGRTEKDPSLARGMSWLIERQRENGSWGGAVSNQGGSAMGEAMWAVLGLVSVDVMTVEVRGIGDGEHVDGVVQLSAEAKDNQGGQVAQLAVFVDDLPVKTVCGSKIEHSWDVKALKDGKHIVDVVAHNARGQESRRRFEVYAGKFYLTQVGARFDEAAQKSQISLRSLSPTGKVQLEVFVSKDGKTGERVFASDRGAQQGAMTFEWDGKGSDGKARARGLYLARLVFRDAAGNAIQKEETSFFHDREEVAKKTFGSVEGQLTMSRGAGVAANTEVELVDDEGRVVQRVRSTEQGNYLFKNVSGGKYRVRMRKDGFAPQESSVEARPATAPAKANFSLH